MRFDIIETLTDIDDEFIASAKPAAQRPIELRPEPRSRRPIRKRFIAAAACTAVAAAALLVFTNVRGGQGGQVPAPADSAQADILEHDYPYPKGVSFYEMNQLPLFSRVEPTIGLDIGKAVEGEDYVFEIEEFPGESFRVTYDGKILDKNGRAVIEAPNLYNAFLYDYNEDGKRDICVTAGYVGAYYVEVYDVENDRNKYNYSVYKIEVVGHDENGEDILHYIPNPYWKPRYLDVFYADKPFLMIGLIEKGKSSHCYGACIEDWFYDEKPDFGESMLVCDSGDLSEGEKVDFVFDEYAYMRLSLEKKGNGAALCHPYKLFFGNKYSTLLEGVQNVYFYDSDSDGKREIWMTYLDGDRSAIVALIPVLIPDTEYVMYFSADDGYRRSLKQDGFELKIVAEPISGGEAVTEPLDLGKMTKQIITPQN